MASKIGDGVENLEHDHNWPKKDTDHLWSDWKAQRAREGANPPTQWRACIHPQCYAVETRETPIA